MTTQEPPGARQPPSGAGKRHRVFASWYPGRAAAMDRAGFASYRARLLAGLCGQVLELGAGSGLNFAHYPAEVERVVAVEPEPRMRELAGEAARRAPVPIEVVDAVAEDLSAFAGRFDFAVCSLVLCSVPDQSAALAQLRTVLRPREAGLAAKSTRRFSFPATGLPLPTSPHVLVIAVPERRAGRAPRGR